MAKVALEFDGFSSLKVTQNLDTIADEFSLEMLQSHSNLEIFKPLSYTPVTLELGKKKLLTGRVMATSARRSASSIGITAQGVSLPASLAQSSLLSIYKENITFKNLVEFIAQKFGLNVICKIETPTIAIAECSTKEKAFSFLNNYAKEHNFLLHSDEHGNIVISSQEPDLESAIVLDTQNSNGAEISVNFDSTKFAQLYVASGQVGDKNLFAQYVYKRVPYFCVKHIEATSDPKQKIRWQIIRDNIDACSISMSMPGWTLANGQHFKRGQIFKLDFPEIWVNGYFRTRKLSFELGSTSRTTNFSLEQVFKDG